MAISVLAGTAAALGEGGPGEAVTAGNAATVASPDGTLEAPGPLPGPLHATTMPPTAAAASAAVTERGERKCQPIRHRRLKDIIPPAGLTRQ